MLSKIYDISVKSFAGVNNVAIDAIVRINQYRVQVLAFFDFSSTDKKFDSTDTTFDNDGV